MKIFMKILMGLSLGMVIFNATQVNWDDPFSDKSSIAVIGIMAALCAFLFLILLMISIKISKKNQSLIFSGQTVYVIDGGFQK